MNTPAASLTAQLIEYNQQLQSYHTLLGQSNTVDHCIHQSLQSSRIRSIYWRILLTLGDSPPDTWMTQINKQRDTYSELYNKYMNNNIVDDIDNHLDPLTASIQQNKAISNGVWPEYWYNTQLLDDIKKDLCRTHGELLYFQSATIQCIMCNVLFVWCKQHPELSYRQGMNEIVAIVVYVLYNDIHTDNHPNHHKPHILYHMLQLRYIEHDVYTVFNLLMNVLSPLYNTDQNSSTNITQRCQQLESQFIQQLNPELHQHLQFNHVSTQLYALRWYRLLFTREYNDIDDILVLWDSIIAHRETMLYYCDCVCSALIIAHTDELMSGDNTDCLTLLMQQSTTGITVRQLINSALNIQRQLDNRSTVLQPPVAHSLQPSTVIHSDASHVTAMLAGATRDITTRFSSGWNNLMSRAVNTYKESTTHTHTSPISASMIALSTSPVNNNVLQHNNTSTHHNDRCCTCRQSNKHLAALLSDSIDILTQQYCPPDPTTDRQTILATDNVLQSIAQIKQVRDILLGDITINDATINSTIQ